MILKKRDYRQLKKKKNISIFNDNRSLLQLKHQTKGINNQLISSTSIINKSFDESSSIKEEIEISQDGKEIEDQPKLISNYKFPVIKQIINPQGQSTFIKSSNNVSIKLSIDANQLKRPKNHSLMRPMFLRNSRIMTEQTKQILQYISKRNKCTSIDYQLSIERQINSVQKQQQKIQKQILDLKNQIKKKRKDQKQQNLLEKCKKLSDEKLCMLKLSEKSFDIIVSIDNKIEYYKEIIKQLSLREQRCKKILSAEELQRRSIFLKWEIQKLQNQSQISVKVLSQEIQTLQEQYNTICKRIFHLKKYSLSIGQQQKQQEKGKRPFRIIRPLLKN